MEKSVIELFAGVGGFRVGLNEIIIEDNKVIENDNYTFVWANQWEPSTVSQHAFDCYQARFGESINHVNTDISLIDKKTIPNHTLLVGGFPCQDYSVARSLSKEKGIEGKKGVLWWQINDILKVKTPPFVLLENVDRLIKSPSKQRGRDFGIMLRCLDDLGYGVEWRVINAAEYGHPQKRRRIYIFAFHKSTKYYNQIITNRASEIFNTNGFFSSTFPIEKNESFTETKITKEFYDDLVKMTQSFEFKFENTGLMLKGTIYTRKSNPVIDKNIITLGDIRLKTPVEDKYFINEYEEKKFKDLKGGKKIERNKNGHTYFYSEGGMSYPDKLNVPGRTMLTSEGTINRSSHVIEDFVTGKNRIITPIETERLNEFPDDWTNTGMPERRRYFMMGNALVCGVIKKMGYKLSNIIESE
ncbi:MAG: DNA (cytosine-5-)-methyltransferase [Tenericutes bacterium HGW-Tenericutes-1]|jgi:DNA (cytosine-5)-methyltransferase 1|nr:MAG: DNA (cytosine-5-)-methyltransferase [Tenericutes bacterium HGW-Tenericutes-1]